MPPASKSRNLQDPLKIVEALESFLAAAKSPVLIESGRPALVIDPQHFRTEVSAGAVLLESWSPEGAAIRRVTALVSRSRNRIELKAKRFAGSDIRLSIVDSAKASPAVASAGHSSEEFLRRLLAREFADGRLSRVSGGPDLANSLSGRYARCLMQQNHTSWAVVAAPPLSGTDACNSALAAGLLWLHVLRQTERRHAVAGLRLFLPLGREGRTTRLLAFLDAERAAYELYAYDPSGSVRRVDLADAGNYAAQLTLRRSPENLGAPLEDWLRVLAARPAVDVAPLADGALSIRVLGLQFAVVRGRRMHFGLEQEIPVDASNFDKVVELADELARFRNPEALDQSHPLYRALPERWLESQIRVQLARLDPELGAYPVYGQAAAVEGADRGLIDLFTLDRSRRLTIIEVKESANLQLPIQALDYWARISRAQQRSQALLRSLFADQETSLLAPRLLLVAPALSFHPTTEILLGFLSAAIPLERIGLNTDWRRGVEKRYHTVGASRPDLFGSGASPIVNS